MIPPRQNGCMDGTYENMHPCSYGEACLCGREADIIGVCSTLGMQLRDTSQVSGAGCNASGSLLAMIPDLASSS